MGGTPGYIPGSTTHWLWLSLSESQFLVHKMGAVAPAPHGYHGDQERIEVDSVHGVQEWSVEGTPQGQTQYSVTPLGVLGTESFNSALPNPAAELDPVVGAWGSLLSVLPFSLLQWLLLILAVLHTKLNP